MSTHVARLVFARFSLLILSLVALALLVVGCVFEADYHKEKYLCADCHDTGLDYDLLCSECLDGDGAVCGQGEVGCFDCTEDDRRYHCKACYEVATDTACGAPADAGAE